MYNYSNRLGKKNCKDEYRSTSKCLRNAVK